MLIDTDTLRESMRQMLLRILDAHYEDPDEPSHRAVWIDLTLDHVGDSADVELARSGVWRGTLADWLRDGPGLVQRVPLVRVELVDRKPCNQFGKFEWWACSSMLATRSSALYWRKHNYLPAIWFSIVETRPSVFVDYDTLELALDDASRRAIRWARSKAKETA